MDPSHQPSIASGRSSLQFPSVVHDSAIFDLHDEETRLSFLSVATLTLDYLLYPLSVCVRYTCGIIVTMIMPDRPGRSIASSLSFLDFLTEKDIEATSMCQFIRDEIRPNALSASLTNKDMNGSQSRPSTPAALPRPPVANVHSSPETQEKRPPCGTKANLHVCVDNSKPGHETQELSPSVRTKGNPQDYAHKPMSASIRSSHETQKTMCSVGDPQLYVDKPRSASVRSSRKTDSVGSKSSLRDEVHQPKPGSYDMLKTSPSVETQGNPQDHVHQHETPKIFSASRTQGNRRDDVHKPGPTDHKTLKITQGYPQQDVHEPDTTNSRATEGNGTPTASVDSRPNHSDLPALCAFLVRPPQNTINSSVSISVNPDLHHDNIQDVIRREYMKIPNGCSSSEPFPVPSPMKENITSKTSSSLGLRPQLFKTKGVSAVHQTPESVRTLWKSNCHIQSISAENLSPDDVIIAIMGPTGVGKSFFIEAATGTNSGVGHNLEPCTTEISATKVTFLGKNVFDVVFVDTPGFDDTNTSDGEILDMIAQWMTRSHDRNVKLSGILYLHRISDNRTPGTPLKNYRIFQKLCGKDALRHIILTTTMWDDVQDDEGDQREKELCANYWKAMTQHGSTLARFLGTTESAWSVVEPLLLETNDRLAASESVPTLWEASRRIQSISPEQLSPDDVIIAVIGPTGAGRSFFIEAATGTTNGVGHNLESCTTEISATKVTFLGKSGFSVVFVDTPGFDDMTNSDGEILDMIAQWLNRSYEQNIKLSGILYLHRISDNRITGTPLKNFHRFKKLCGTDALRRIILTTAMWNDVEDGEAGRREEELCTKHWKTMIQQGSTVARFLGTTESAWRVVEPLILEANDRFAVEIRRDLNGQLPETEAGKELYVTLNKLVHKQREVLRRIREEAGDDQILNKLKSEYTELRKDIKTTIEDIPVLKLPLGMQLIRFLFWPLLLVRGIRK